VRVPTGAARGAFKKEGYGADTKPMRKSLALAVLSAACMLMPAPAEAQSWKRCGNWSPSTGWTYDQIVGFQYFNLRALNVPCRTARRVANRSARWDFESRPGGGVQYGEGRFSEWTCYLRFFKPPQEATRHRCRAPGGRRANWISAV
jgi:hypothetical protein